MCGEFYPGWFDTWGQPHHLGNTPRYLADLQYMLSHGESFSIYMVHGGSTFGLWPGADHPFKPDTSSYDYDAPISEAGWPTEKFYKTRALFSQYLLPGETLPDIPATNAVIAFPPVAANECAPVFENLPNAITDATPQTMEQYDQGHGCILYRATIPAGSAGMLTANSVHDFGFVFLDGQRAGIMDRRSNHFSVPLPERKNPTRLDILVEAMGRVNFGIGIADRKGIHAPIELDGVALNNWNIYNFPLDNRMLAGLKFQKLSGDYETSSSQKAPTFWRAVVKIKKPGDTFLDMSSWGKGVVWINGHCLGRFWNIGPTQTMYVPGPWLKRGKNEIIVFDLLGPEKPMIAGVGHPVLDELHPEKDFAGNEN
jgi:beta-galactosidase